MSRRLGRPRLCRSLKTSNPEYVIVGRVRRAHGLRGEVVITPLTDDVATVFAVGRQVFAGTSDGEVAADAQKLTVRRQAWLKDAIIVRFAEIADRNAADLWRDRYLLSAREDLRPPESDEVYYHDLVGLRVEDQAGATLGKVSELYELPQGLMLEVTTEKGTAMVPYRPEVITLVDVARGVLVVDPPEGLFE